MDWQYWTLKFNTAAQAESVLEPHLSSSTFDKFPIFTVTGQTGFFRQIAVKGEIPPALAAYKTDFLFSLPMVVYEPSTQLVS